MKKNYLFLFLLMMTASFGWGQTVVSYDFSDGGAVTGLNEASPGISLDANIGFGSFKNSGTANPALNSGQLRLYQNATKGGSIKIYANNGVTITKVVVNASGTTGPAAYTVDGGSATDLSASTTYTMTGLTATSVIEFYQKDGSSSNRIYVDDFEVTYTAAGPSAPSVTTDAASNIAATTATLNGTVNDNGAETTVVFKYSTSDGGPYGTSVTADESPIGSGSGNTSVSYELSGLTTGTTYYYVVEASNSEGTTSGSQESFTPSNEVTIAYQDFEGGSDNWNYTPDPVAFSVGSDIWDVVDNSFHTFGTIPSSGTEFWGILDLENGNGGTSSGEWATLTFNTVDISSYINVEVSFDYEVDGFDNGDDIKYEIFHDASGQGEILEVDGSSNLNKDGTVNLNVPDNVDAIYLVVSVKQNGSDYGALDNFKIKGTPDAGTSGLWKTDAATTDWFTGSNWDDGNVPNSGVDVSIPTGATNYPTITGATTAECNALALASGSSLTIAADGSLTTSGVYSNPSGGTLTIESDGTNNGSFIPFGVSGPADIELYITGHAGVDANGWHLVSSPNTDATFDVSGSDFEPGGSDDFYWWNETNYTWENYKETSFDFERGHGYLCAYNSTATKVFDGWPNAGNVTVGSLSCQNTANDDGWNLLGNPFPSDIIWNETAGDWTLSEVGGVAQVFNSTNRNYDAVAADESIASMQGFFVQVNAGQTGSVTIPATARDHGNSKWMKSSKAAENSLKLKVTGGTVPYYDQTQVKFINGATDEYDYQFDGHKLFGYQETPRLYTANGEEMFSINSLAFSNEEKILPLSFLAGTNGDFTIEIVQNTIMAEGNTYLEDLVTGQMINLDQQSSYTFQATTSDDENRFLLHFNGVTGVEDLEDNNNIQVYSVDDMIYINSLEDLSADILVYNINGQLIHNDQMNVESLKRISLGTSAGVYLVSIVSEETTITHKVYIK